MNSVQIEEAIKNGFDARRNRDFETAKKEFQNAIDLGSAKAFCYLGNLYERENDKDKAFELYQKAADLGEPLGYTYMGDYYSSLSMDYEGEGDDEKAQECYKLEAEYYEKAHLGKEVKATYLLANCYKHGQGVPADKEKALQLFEEIVQMEESAYHKYAYLELSRKYSIDNRFIDEEKCLNLLYRSAAQSYAAAYEELGKLTAGKGDVPLANAYYKKAAELYREQHIEFAATKAEEKIVPCDTEVEPFIGTFSDEMPEDDGYSSDGKTFMMIHMTSFDQLILRDYMRKQGFSPVGTFDTLDEAMEKFVGNKPYIIFYNMIPSSEHCLEIEMIKEVIPSTRIIMMVDEFDRHDKSIPVEEWSPEKNDAVLVSLAILRGASDYIVNPINYEDLVTKVNMAIENNVIYEGANQGRLPYIKEAWWLNGTMYFNEERYSEAIEWFEKSAKAGYVPAMIILATLYNGDFGVKDRSKAEYWAKQAGYDGVE